MARISVVGTPFEKALLNDIDKKQSLREHTINPPGQERYIRPIDKDALQAVFEAKIAAPVLMTAVDTFITRTVGANNVSRAVVKTAAEVITGGLDPVETGSGPQKADYALVSALQNLISYRLVETGSFLLSFHNGVIRGMLSVTDDNGTPTPWIKVFNEDGDALFTL